MVEGKIERKRMGVCVRNEGKGWFFELPSCEQFSSVFFNACLPNSRSFLYMLHPIAGRYPIAVTLPIAVTFSMIHMKMIVSELFSL